MDRKKIKEAILSGNLYDFLCNNAHRMSSYELAEIAKNLDFTAYSDMKSINTYEEFNECLIQNLNDLSFFEED